MTALLQGTGWQVVWSFIESHQTIAALAIAWVGSNIVSALPSPNNESGQFYKFFFAFLHGLAGSFPRVFPTLRVFGDSTQGSQTYFKAPDPKTP